MHRRERAASDAIPPRASSQLPARPCPHWGHERLFGDNAGLRRMHCKSGAARRLDCHSPAKSANDCDSRGKLFFWSLVSCLTYGRRVPTGDTSVSIGPRAARWTEPSRARYLQRTQRQSLKTALSIREKFRDKRPNLPLLISRHHARLDFDGKPNRIFGNGPRLILP